MTLTVTQTVLRPTLTVTSNEVSVVINPVVMGSNGRYIYLDGFEVDATGKTTTTAWEVGDTFSGWNGNNFVRGKILALPVTMPDDLTDNTKVGLVINNTF